MNQRPSASKRECEIMTVEVNVCMGPTTIMNDRGFCRECGEGQVPDGEHRSCISLGGNIFPSIDLQAAPSSIYLNAP